MVTVGPVDTGSLDQISFSKMVGGGRLEQFFQGIGNNQFLLVIFLKISQGLDVIQLRQEQVGTFIHDTPRR